MEYESIKALAKERGCSHKELLALTDVNDPFYITPADRQKAEWVTMVYHKEGFSKKIHPRGVHYTIVDKGYKMPNGDIYGNEFECWNFLQLGFKYARFLGLIKYDDILDMKNDDGEETGDFSQHDGIGYDVGYSCSSDLSEDDDDDKFIEDIITNKKNNFSVDYNSNLMQPFYIEIWAEKSGIIPREVAQKFNATMRPAGGGEFSLDMCHRALKRAEELNKPLFIFLLSDFDPKGDDMKKSISRKVEFEAKKRGITAYMKPIGLTKAQCESYDLPSIPAKKPKGGNSRGARAYKTHTKKFYDAMGRQTTEINSFMARDEESYEEEIRKAIEPFYDDDMAFEVRMMIDGVYEEIEDFIKNTIEENKKEIIEVALKLTEANEKLEIFIEREKELLGISKMQHEFYNLTKIDENEIIGNLDIDFPVSEVEPPTDALLDTTRDYLEQIKVYKQNDIRTSNKMSGEPNDN